jgi:hypothetical protein
MVGSAVACFGLGAAVRSRGYACLGVSVLCAISWKATAVQAGVDAEFRGLQMRKFSFTLRRIYIQKSYIQPTAKTALARAALTRANLECMICVNSKLALFTKSPEVSSIINTVCLSVTISYKFKSHHTNRFCMVAPHSER